MANAGNGVDDFITPAIYLEILKQGEQIGHPTAQQGRPQLAAAAIFRFSSASRACPGMLTAPTRVSCCRVEMTMVLRAASS